MVSGGRNATFLFAIRFDLKITKKYVYTMWYWEYLW